MKVGSGQGDVQQVARLKDIYDRRLQQTVDAQIARTMQQQSLEGRPSIIIRRLEPGEGDLFNGACDDVTKIHSVKFETPRTCMRRNPGFRQAKFTIDAENKYVTIQIQSKGGNVYQGEINLHVLQTYDQIFVEGNKKKYLVNTEAIKLEITKIRDLGAIVVPPPPPEGSGLSAFI